MIPLVDCFCKHFAFEPVVDDILMVAPLLPELLRWDGSLSGELVKRGNRDSEVFCGFCNG